MKRLMKGLGVFLGGNAFLFGVFVALVVTGVAGPPGIPPEIVARSVNQDAALLESAMNLPVASKYGREIYFQKNGSYCGPASLLNVFRSWGGSPQSVGDVLSGSGKCVLGFCAMGLTLDELAHVARNYGVGQV